MSARFSLGFAGLVTTGALLLLAVNFYGGDSGFTRPRGSSVLEAGTAANQIPLVNSLDLPSVRAEGADWREKATCSIRTEDEIREPMALWHTRSP